MNQRCIVSMRTLKAESLNVVRSSQPSASHTYATDQSSQSGRCAFAETARATGDAASLGAGLAVLSTVQQTLARAAASPADADADADGLLTTHRTRKLLRTLRADGGVTEAVRQQAKQLLHATRHAKHAPRGGAAGGALAPASPPQHGPQHVKRRIHPEQPQQRADRVGPLVALGLLLS